MKLPVASALLLFGSILVPAKDYVLHSFKKTQLLDQFWSEGANFGDFNRDGKMDIVSGPFWWEGPDFKKRHEYSETSRTSPAGKAPFRLKKDDGVEVEIPGFEGVLGKQNTYSDNFFAFTHDFDRDGWTDILII